jgi:hypothetical protein
MELAFALAGGAWIFLGAVLLILVGVIFGYYTRTGSGISERPYGKVYGGAPGAKGPGSTSGRDDRVTMRNWSRGAR